MWTVLLLLQAACEYRPRTPVEHPNTRVLLPDSMPSLDEARIGPDRVPDLRYVYRSSGEDFQINFPSQPKVSSSMISSNQGQIELNTLSVDFSVTKAYWASYSDYPSAFIGMKPAYQVLTDARQYIVEHLGSGTVFEVLSDTLRQDYPALRFRARDGHFHAVYELILVENRLYQLGVLRDGKYPQAADYDRFFDSFQLLDLPL